MGMGILSGCEGITCPSLTRTRVTVVSMLDFQQRQGDPDADVS